MSHIYSAYKILILLSICLFIAFSGCKDNTDSKKNVNSDSVNSEITNQNVSDTASDTSLDNTLKQYLNKYKTTFNREEYNKENKSIIVRELKNKYLVFPVFKEQIKYLLQSNVSDTILIYSDKYSNSFVLNISKGEDLFKKLKYENNGLIVIHTEVVSYSQKLYLTKKYTDFQHKEKKVTEYYIKAELIEANNISVKDALLKEKFNLEE